MISHYFVIWSIAGVAAGYVLSPHYSFICSDILNLTTSNFNDERIIGGHEVKKNAFPFMVRLQAVMKGGLTNVCGATLIHERFAVTAAHCVYNAQLPRLSVNLYFGKHNLFETDETQNIMEIPMTNVFVHPNFDKRTRDNDIALIKLTESAPISSYVKPICVSAYQTAKRYQSGIALGWGQTTNGGHWSDVLKQVNLPIMHDSKCGFRLFNKQTMLCAGNMKGIEEAICSGDSGGPLVVNPSQPILVGISSHVSVKGCVAVGYGVVFTRVSTYINWMNDLMGGELCFV